MLVQKNVLQMNLNHECDEGDANTWKAIEKSLLLAAPDEGVAGLLKLI